MSKTVKVMLDTTRIKPIDSEEEKLLKDLNWEVFDFPQNIVNGFSKYKWEDNMGIFKPLKSAFYPSELVSYSQFSRNPGKFIKLLQERKVEKIWLLKNNKLVAVVYPV